MKQEPFEITNQVQFLLRLSILRHFNQLNLITNNFHFPIIYLASLLHVFNCFLFTILLILKLNFDQCVYVDDYVHNNYDRC